MLLQFPVRCSQRLPAERDGCPLHSPIHSLSRFTHACLIYDTIKRSYQMFMKRNGSKNLGTRKSIYCRSNCKSAHVANRRISISHLLSLWRHSRHDVSRLRRSQHPFSLRRHSHCDVIRYWAGHAHRHGRTYITDTLPRLIGLYKDYRHFDRSTLLLSRGRSNNVSIIPTIITWLWC